MDSKLQIFISSTYQDLISERQAAVESVLKAGHFPAGMELFTAGDKSQWEVIQRWITDSDIYMLILGGRYGSIEPTSGLSYTELEYDFAVSMGKPFFAVVITDVALDCKVKTLGISCIEKDKPDKLKAFRDKVLSKISSFFSDCKDIKLAVLETVPQLAREYELKGWVRATKIPDTEALTGELLRLQAENKTLQEKIAGQTKQLDKNKPSTTNEQKEFAELFDVLTNIKVNLKDVKKIFANGGTLPDEMDLLNLALNFKDSLMSGVTNAYGSGEIASFIFFNLCPKLQVYELVENEKVPGVKYRRYAISKKGIKFFAFVEKILIKAKSKSTTEKQRGQSGKN